MSRQTPPTIIAYVPTPAMLAGDFTTYASAGVPGARRHARRGFVEQSRSSLRAFSPAAVNMAGRLPKTTDPCGQITYSLPERQRGRRRARPRRLSDGRQPLAVRSIHGQFDKKPSPFGTTGNVLTTPRSGSTTCTGLALGDTKVFGANAVNSLRLAFNRTAVNRSNDPWFSPYDLGVKVYSYSPGAMS